MTAPLHPSLLGLVADDVTGGTDAASALAECGLRVVQVVGVPEESLAVPECDAVVVSLKSRTAKVSSAVAESLAAARWLAHQGAEVLVLKVCSTFDSTSAGNIGPVAQALRDDLGAGLVAVCPANPENGRTVFQGHLFLGRVLLEKSPMAEHPLTPMTRSDLVVLLGEQTAGAVGLVPLEVVREGAAAIAAALSRLEQAGSAFAVVDAAGQQDLEALARGWNEARLWVGASGLVRALGGARQAGQEHVPAPRETFASEAPGATLLLAGSSSAATREQVARFLEHFPGLRLDPLRVASDAGHVAEVTSAAQDVLRDGQPVLVYATAAPEEVRRVHETLGPSASTLVEQALAEVGRACVAAGVRRLVVAGGETSGAVLRSLGVRRLRIGTAIAPGVPWTLSENSRPPVALALKSGNFGGPDFFLAALDGAG